MVRLTLFIVFLFCIESTKASDSVYVKFADKMVSLPQNKFSTFSIKKNTFLLVTIPNSDTVKCFVFKRNRLIQTGRMILKKDRDNKIALRDGYWIAINDNKPDIKTYYINDEILVMDESVPVKNEE